MAKSKDVGPGATVGVRLPAEAHHRLKVYAAQNKTHVWRVLAEAVDEFLANRKKRGA